MTTAVARLTDAEWAGSCQENVILLADDDPACLLAVGNMLEAGGYEVVTASDGVETLELLERHSPALLLLNLEMSRLSGLDVCRRMKADLRYADVPIVFLTSASEPQAKAKGFEVGGADCVTKPVEQMELLARIRCHIELAATRRALRSRAELYENVATEQMGRLEQVRWGQASMLTAPASFPELKVAVRMVTANEAGGDFYEISRLADERFGFLVTDVAGHDLSIPFVTGALKALAGLCLNESMTPCETMIMFNSGLRKVLSEERFVTGCYAVFDRDGMCVEVINAGHPPALIQRRGGGCEYVEAGGDLLGIFEQVRFEPACIKVAAGDRLFMYTDGLMEGYRDESGRQGRLLTGMRLFRNRVEELSCEPVNKVVHEIVRQVVEASGEHVSDDMVLLGIEF